MCPRTSRQFESIRQEKTRLILDTALELFAEKGYHVSSVNDIARKAGISKGLLYNYFDGKEAVLKCIIKKGYDAAYSNPDYNIDEMLIQDEFISFIRYTFRMVRENQRFWKLFTALMFQPEIQDMLLSDYAGQAVQIQKLMTGFLKASGSIAPETDMLVLSALIKGAHLILITAPDFFMTDSFEETILDACFRLINRGDKTEQFTLLNQTQPSSNYNL